MAANTPSTVQRESNGSNTLYIYTFTSLADGDTYNTGLGTNILTGGYWANSEVSSETPGDEGVNVANSSGTLTFNSKTTGLVNVFVLART